MYEVRIDDIIEIPTGADGGQRRPYQLLVTNVFDCRADGRAVVDGQVLNQDGTHRKRGYRADLSLDLGLVELVNPTTTDRDGALLQPGSRIVCVGAQRALMTGQTGVIWDIDRKPGGDVLIVEPVIGNVSTNAPRFRRPALSSRLCPQGATVDAVIDPSAETRPGRYGPVEVSVKDTTTPGSIVETEIETGIETVVSLPGTHPRGPVQPRVGVSGATLTSWRRVIEGVLFHFSRITMPDGGVRFVVQRHTGYVDLRFSCAWTQTHFIAVPPRPAPATSRETRQAPDVVSDLVETGRDRAALSMAAAALVDSKDNWALTASQAEIVRAQVQPASDHSPYLSPRVSG
jgi:hypothetical protein